MSFGKTLISIPMFIGGIHFDGDIYQLINWILCWYEQGVGQCHSTSKHWMFSFGNWIHVWPPWLSILEGSQHVVANQQEEMTLWQPHVSLCILVLCGAYLVMFWHLFPASSLPRFALVYLIISDLCPFPFTNNSACFVWLESLVFGLIHHRCHLKL